MPRNIREDKKGLHPAAWVLILVLLVIVIAGIAYIWNTAVNRAGNGIYIQNINFREEKTIIYVQNIGGGPVSLYSAEINKQLFPISQNNCIIDKESTILLKEGKMAEITIQQSYKDQIHVHVKVVCTDGTMNEGEYPVT